MAGLLRRIALKHHILHQGSGGIVLVELNAGEQITAESDAMVAMSSSIEVGATTGGGIMKALGRAFLSGETLFMQTLKAVGDAGQVFIAPPLPGSVQVLKCEPGQGWQIQQGSFLAALGMINVETKMQNLGSGFFSGAGLFVTKATGKGHVAVSAFAGIEELVLDADTEFVVDTGHIVAWTDGMRIKVQKAAKKGLLASAASGEYLVCRFTGPGSVWIQTRNPKSFSAYVQGLMPSK